MRRRRAIGNFIRSDGHGGAEKGERSFPRPQPSTDHHARGARYIGIAASLVVPSESLRQLAAYRMQASLMRDVNLTPFSPASVPSPAMVVWAALDTASTLGLALLLFQPRNL